MDVKSAFLNGYIEEEVYVRQPLVLGVPSFQTMFSNFKKLCMVWNKALNPGMSVWIFCLERVLKWALLIKPFFLLKHGNDTLLLQIYMDDILFSGSSHALVSKFLDTMSREFENSMMQELNFFLGLQIKQTQDMTFVH
jgi:hypothetical protein